MDIRTKLIFAFVATSLLSMAVLGTYSFGAAADMLKSVSVRQLDALAAARAQDIAVIARAWRDEVNLIKSRTELRRQLDELSDQGEAARARIQRIIEDAESSVDIITRVTVYDRNQDFVASAGNSERRGETLGERHRRGFGVAEYVKRPDGGVDVVLHAALRLNGDLVGFIGAVVDTRDLMNIVESRRGLGETGEMLLLAELAEGTVTQFNPPRHREGDWLATYPLSRASELVRQVVEGGEDLLLNVADYRGEPVWAAVRPMPDGFPGWMVVKIDAEEELAPVVELRGRLIDVALAVGALAILAGAALGIFLARPVRKLNQVVERIRHGESGLRADESGEDEVSFLAESFNDLMDQMERRRD